MAIFSIKYSLRLFNYRKARPFPQFHLRRCTTHEIILKAGLVVTKHRPSKLLSPDRKVTPAHGMSVIHPLARLIKD
jgi:hypothetical protein